MARRIGVELDVLRNEVRAARRQLRVRGDDAYAPKRRYEQSEGEQRAPAPEQARRMEARRSHGSRLSGATATKVCVRNDESRPKACSAAFWPAASPSKVKTMRELSCWPSTLSGPRDQINAKYINTPDTQLYHKNQVLYGIDLAKKQIVDKRQVVIVRPVESRIGHVTRPRK